MDAAAAPSSASTSASASADRSNPSGSAVQVRPSALPTAVLFCSLRAGVWRSLWVDGAMLVEIRGSCGADRWVSAGLRRDLVLFVRDFCLGRQILRRFPVLGA
jgi:hypothetical protein